MGRICETGAFKTNSERAMETMRVVIAGNSDRSEVNVTYVGLVVVFLSMLCKDINNNRCVRGRELAIQFQVARANFGKSAQNCKV